MMIREDLVKGAVSFLQDPSVASAPLEQRIAFLKSKNLTQEEVDVSLARAGPSPTNPTTQASFPAQYRGPQQYGQYQQPPYWAQPPPEAPRRDWRDWFIVATVATGASYALYWTAKRYIYPLITPPTPPQLEQDKASIDASFDKAFALLDQLAADTQELKESEKARATRLDEALTEVEEVAERLKTSNQERDRDAKRFARELDDIRESIPRALEKEKERLDGRLNELVSEMKSLKTLLAGRVGAPARNIPGFPGSGSVVGGASSVNGIAPTNGTPAPQPSVSDAPESDVATNDNAAAADRATTPTSYSRILGSGKAQIPSWQLAAKKKNEEAKEAAGQGIGQSGTVTGEGSATS